MKLVHSAAAANTGTLLRHRLPFEVKASQSVTASDASPIERWIALNPGHGPGIVIHTGTDYLALSKNVRAIPATALFCHVS